jgi:amidohydrolase
MLDSAFCILQSALCNRRSIVQSFASTVHRPPSMTPVLRNVLAAVLAFPAVALAQETPTERAAASEVMKQMSALEQSLDLPKLVARLTAPDAAREAVVARTKELMDKELLAMADDITRHPEVGFKEERSVKILTEYLKAHDFDVEMGVAGLKTAFVAHYKKGTPGPNLGVILEYDALRGTNGDFHGDQHSAQGPVGMAVAVAVSEFLTRSKTPGTVTVYGTPAEEMSPPSAKTVMFDAGVFKGADIIVRSHAVVSTGRPAPGFGTCCLNIDNARYIFAGAPAHQMTAWEGRDALTAVIHLFENIDALRKTMRPEARIQGIITEGGKAPNVVPDRAVAEFYVRYPDEVYLAQEAEMVDNAARAAALATGTKVKIEREKAARDGISLGSLGELAFAFMKQYGGTHVQMEPGKPQGFEETGSVSSAIPGIGVTARSSNGGNHTYEMLADATTEVGHQGFVVDAETMSAILFAFATHEDYRKLVLSEFNGLKAMKNQYIEDLKKAYPLPVVKDPD